MTRNLDAERSNLDLAGFAQEFLRRNPAYRAGYAALMQRPPGGRSLVAHETMARAWGLAFPMRA